MSLTEKRVITVQPPTAAYEQPIVRFRPDQFNQAIFQHGYNVHHEKAVECPCRVKDNSTPLPNCTNCGGIGWFYVEKRKTKALMQGMGNNKKFENWSEENMGTVTITNNFVDDVSYMDKFTILDLRATFSQVLYPRLNEAANKLFAFTIYEPLKIDLIYGFVNSSTILTKYVDYAVDPVNWDYKVSNNIIEFNMARITVPADNQTEFSVSVRYRHYPVYAVVDIQREIFQSEDGTCMATCVDGDGTLKGMPQKSIGRRFHYIFDAKNLQGVKVHDNTDYTKFDASTVQ
jgi:hypothetical protein